MNNIFIAGHLGADPEVRFTSTGKKVTSLRVACRTRKAGKDDTIWWRVSVWGEEFDNMLPHFKKGSSIMVYGEIQKPEIFNDREGKPQISLDIRAMSLHFSPFGKSDKDGAGAATAPGMKPTSHDAPPTNPYAAAAMAAPVGSPKGETHDDEVPF